MSITQIELIYHVVYFLILISICAWFSRRLLSRVQKFNLNYWIMSTILFTGISLGTVSLWYVTIGFIF